jgi:hypothetical protein
VIRGAGEGDWSGRSPGLPSSSSRPRRASRHGSPRWARASPSPRTRAPSSSSSACNRTAVSRSSSAPPSA